MHEPHCSTYQTYPLPVDYFVDYNLQIGYPLEVGHKSITPHPDFPEKSFILQAFLRRPHQLCH